MDSPSIIRVVLAQASDAAAVPEAAAPAVPDYGFWSSILNAGLFEQAVMALLLVFSVISWAIIYFKARGLSRAYSESDSFLDIFWGSKRLDAIYQKSEGLAASPVSKVFRAGYVELAKLKKKDGDESKEELSLGALESVQRSMRRASASEITGLESLIPFLATVGSTAPFIGLL
ncbi:MAG: MotA/TolQ/ExbB proton channel family protein, partial [Myxococcota bacterium]